MVTKKTIKKNLCFQTWHTRHINIFFLCLFSIKRNLLSLKQIIIRDLLFICLTCCHVIIPSFLYFLLRSILSWYSFTCICCKLWLLKIASLNQIQHTSDFIWKYLLKIAFCKRSQPTIFFFLSMHAYRCIILYGIT